MCMNNFNHEDTPRLFNIACLNRILLGQSTPKYAFVVMKLNKLTWSDDQEKEEQQHFLPANMLLISRRSEPYNHLLSTDIGYW